MKERENHLANLKAIRSTVDEAIKQVEKEIRATETVELAEGQVWKNVDGNYYLTAINPNDSLIILVRIDKGFFWSENGFGKSGKAAFTYIGKSSEVISLEFK